MSHPCLARLGGSWPAAAVLLLFALPALAADVPGRPASDEGAIRAAVESYVDAYNRGAARAVAAHWSESGEWVSPSGRRVRGRGAIEGEMKALFAASPAVRIEVEPPRIRLISKDVAVEDGVGRVLRPSESPTEATYLAIHVKQGGDWKLDSVRETDVPVDPPPASALQELAWLVGEWVDDSPEATVETSVSWTKNKTFLSYSFRVSVPDMDDLEGTQVIGWDPVAGTIRSWMFDSDGGFGEGGWSPTASGWSVRFSQVLPDGRKAAATNIYTIVDANTFTWKSIGRQVDGEFQPNLDEARVVRKGAVEATGKSPRARPREAKP